VGKAPQVKLPSETVLTFALQAPLTVVPTTRAPNPDRPRVDSPTAEQPRLDSPGDGDQRK
jgi:hypothetical protein